MMVWAGRGGQGLGRAPLTAVSHRPPRINNDLLMWEPADLLPAPAPAAPPAGCPDASGFWQDSFKMCKSAFKLGRQGAPVASRAPGQTLPPPPGLPATQLLDLILDSDSDDEDTHFSVGASGAPRPLARESRSPRSQSTFSALVTVLKGRITAHCETKVRHRGGDDSPGAGTPDSRAPTGRKTRPV